MDKELEKRLNKIEVQLKEFSQVLENLGRDAKRSIAAVRDGYYEASLTNAGSIIEDILRDIWIREKISGQPSKKTIEQLFGVIKEQVPIDRIVEDYIRDIQLVRNRAAHGQPVVAEDALETLRKLNSVLDWYLNKYLRKFDKSPASATMPTINTTKETLPKAVLNKDHFKEKKDINRKNQVFIGMIGVLIAVLIGIILFMRFVRKSGNSPNQSLAQTQEVSIPSNSQTSAFRSEVISDLRSPKIVLTKGGVNIPKGSEFQLLAPDFSKNIDVLISIENRGSKDLILTEEPPVTIQGNETSMFTIAQQPTKLIAPNSKGFFILRFLPLSENVSDAILSIFSNDENIPIFSLNLRGKIAEKSPILHLRSFSQSLKEDDVRMMLRNKGLFSKNDGWNSNFCNPSGAGIDHGYELKTIDGDKIVIDHATNLTWHQSGSSSFFSFQDAIEWLRNLNTQGYAGYSDWRLPTLEEAASLLENNGGVADLDISSMFDKTQWYIWTCDSYDSSAWWVVRFGRGGVVGFARGNDVYVRPVRSGN